MPPLALVFEFNPQTLTRSRNVQVTAGGAPGTRGGYDFASPLETARVAQGVEVQKETFSIEVLFDASDAIADGDPVAKAFGVQPQLDTLREMLEPKTAGPPGLKALTSLGQGGLKAFERNETVSVHLFIWGAQVLPVFLTSVQQNETQHLPNLFPHRATVQIGMEIIAGNNPFIAADRIRRTVTSALNTARPVGGALASLL